MSLVDVDQPDDGAVQPRRGDHHRRVHGYHFVAHARSSGSLQPHATLVSRRTVLLRGRPRWLAVGRRWGRGWRLRVYLVGQETVRLHVGRRMVMVVLMVMGVEDRLRRSGRARGADADADAHPDADRGVREGGRRDRRRDRRRRRRYRRRHRDRGDAAGGRAGARRGLVVQYRHPDQPLSGVRHVRRLQLGGELPLPLVTPILKPNLHLGLGEPERGREPRSLRRREVALHVECALQLEHLRPREHRSRLLLALYAVRLATVHANLHAVLAAVATRTTTAAASATSAAAAAHRSAVETRRRRLAFAVGVRAVVPVAEVVVRLVAARRASRPVQPIVGVVVVELVCAERSNTHSIVVASSRRIARMRHTRLSIGANPINERARARDSDTVAKLCDE